MKHLSLRPLSFLLLLLIACLALACGGGSNRRLQSIAISAVANGGQISFVATGTYNASPTTVTPLPVFWYVMDPPTGYTLTAQPFVVSCSLPGITVTATAPVNPSAPSTGPISSAALVVATAPFLCP
jgi:hypothetical protein